MPDAKLQRSPFAIGLTPLSPRARRVLWLALGVSLVLHLALTLWPISFGPEEDATVLKATLTELPPPPAPVAQPAPAAPRPAPARRRVPVTPVPGPVALPPADLAPTEAPPAPEPAPAATTTAETPVPPAEAPAAAPPETIADPRTLPPRVDLAYKVFWGTQGFEIGEAVYRFEHRDNRYRITTLGQARGLAALVLRGQGKLESTGAITPQGLKPDLLRIERGGPDRVEFVAFDRTRGVVTLRDGTPRPLVEPTFDPLSLMWQYYFTPPSSDRVTVTVATPRRLVRYTITREGTETIEWPNGPIQTERWHRRSEDGKTDAYIWLAPSLRHIPVKIRVSNTERGTLEVMLDSIRVDEDPAAVGRDDLVVPKTDPGPPPDSPIAAPRPAETFPTMTGQ